MTSPEIRELQVFLAMVRTGSFSAAAKQLGISQPAVSAQIAKLEQTIGYPLFHRYPEGTEITDQGQALVPLIQEIEKDYSDLIRRAAYWKRYQAKQVKIWTDGSLSARISRQQSREDGGLSAAEEWHDLDTHTDWVAALGNFEVDIVLAGSFLKTGNVPGIQTTVLHRQNGITVAWNPTYYAFGVDPFSFPDAISSTVILPAPSLASGFREFLSQWCESAYGFALKDVVVCANELDAVDACKLGLGVIIFPGDAGARMDLESHSLRIARTFEFLLPNAFTFGIRHRADERNPQVLATVGRLSKILAAS